MCQVCFKLLYQIAKTYLCGTCYNQIFLKDHAELFHCQPHENIITNGFKKSRNSWFVDWVLKILQSCKPFSWQIFFIILHEELFFPPLLIEKWISILWPIFLKMHFPQKCHFNILIISQSLYITELGWIFDHHLYSINHHTTQETKVIYKSNRF